ncbi:MAG: flagellar basal body-associated FliL family protein [Marinobacter sp.]|uniref:flagellar basal body-associated FliL family protein n=1 Tax=Marinobacter sp. TaxID=50741 RepID=UPI00299E0F03|nr:flagellar basal body-associated FliL family protein [Marinobacter sp.]MDX1755202.1 flagellar basal body-associated FliL family protein [Marinobacter sp.]
MNAMSFLRLLTLLCLLPLAAAPALAEDNGNGDGEDSEAASEPAVTDYIELEPAFVTHVGQPDQKVEYLKAAVTLRATRETTRTAVETHMPRLRHELVLLFGEQTDLDRLTSPEGKQALRDEALRRINAVLEEQQTGEAIADVVFTTFVVQR